MDLPNMCRLLPKKAAHSEAWPQDSYSGDSLFFIGLTVGHTLEVFEVVQMSSERGVWTLWESIQNLTTGKEGTVGRLCYSRSTGDTHYHSVFALSVLRNYFPQLPIPLVLSGLPTRGVKHARSLSCSIHAGATVGPAQSRSLDLLGWKKEQLVWGVVSGNLMPEVWEGRQFQIFAKGPERCLVLERGLSTEALAPWK